MPKASKAQKVMALTEIGVSGFIDTERRYRIFVRFYPTSRLQLAFPRLRRRNPLSSNGFHELVLFVGEDEASVGSDTWDDGRPVYGYGMFVYTDNPDQYDIGTLVRVGAKAYDLRPVKLYPVVDLRRHYE